MKAREIRGLSSCVDLNGGGDSRPGKIHFYNRIQQNRHLVSFSRTVALYSLLIVWTAMNFVHHGTGTFKIS